MQCSSCNNEFNMPAERCPHCAEPGIFSNVWAASQPEERAALDRRFQAALDDAAARGCDAIVRDFIVVLAGSRAVIARHIADIERMARTDSECYATFHQLLEAGIRAPDGDAWNTLRSSADEALFPTYKEQIRFAALTLDGLGPLAYGDWSMVLRTPMIERRASAFEENSLVFIKRHKVSIADAARELRGYRSSWQERAKLCVAKLAAEITSATTAAELAGLLLHQGGGTGTDRFVEIHVWGPMTIRTAEEITLKKGKDTRRLASKARLGRIRDHLKQVGVKLVVQP